MKTFNPDAMGEKLLRRFAGGTSRRGILSRLGLALVAAPAFPLLPVSRASAAKPDRSPEAKTHLRPQRAVDRRHQVRHWRYCAIDGSLCSSLRRHAQPSARRALSTRRFRGSAPASIRTMAAPI